jgi:hypothetical protein
MAKKCSKKSKRSLKKSDNPHRYVGLSKINRKRFLVDYTSGQIDPESDGECYHNPIHGIITIDPTLRGKECFDTTVHEVLHGYFDYSKLLSKKWRKGKKEEQLIRELATQITDVIFTPECMRRCGF